MALMVPTGYLVSTGETRNDGEGITQSYFAALEANSGEPVSYRFYALWEGEDSKWASLQEIKDYLHTEAEIQAIAIIQEILTVEITRL